MPPDPPSGAAISSSYKFGSSKKKLLPTPVHCILETIIVCITTEMVRDISNIRSDDPENLLLFS